MFAIMNMFTSLYVETAREHNERDAMDVIQDEIQEQKKNISKFLQLFADVDGDHSGDISVDEFNYQLESQPFLALMSGLGIEIHDALQFFDLLSDRGQHLVDGESFLTGCMKMKGTAKSVDLLGLVHAQRKSAIQQADFMEACQREFAKLEQQLQHRASIELADSDGSAGGRLAEVS